MYTRIIEIFGFFSREAQWTYRCSHQKMTEKNIQIFLQSCVDVFLDMVELSCRCTHYSRKYCNRKTARIPFSRSTLFIFIWMNVYRFFILMPPEEEKKESNEWNDLKYLFACRFDTNGCTICVVWKKYIFLLCKR